MRCHTISPLWFPPIIKTSLILSLISGNALIANAMLVNGPIPIKEIWCGFAMIRSRISSTAPFAWTIEFMSRGKCGCQKSTSLKPFDPQNGGSAQIDSVAPL